MMDMTIKVEVPSLATAIEKLASALTRFDPAILTPDEPLVPELPQAAPAPAPAAVPTAAPAAPVSAPVTSTPTPAPAPAVSAPVATPVAPVQTVTPASPVSNVATAPAAPVTGVPVASAPTYTLDQISRAGASLVDAGKMEPLLALLGRYGVAAVTQLKPEQYGAFATELRALGAQI